MDYAGILLADAYAGYNRLYAPDRQPGPITEVAGLGSDARYWFWSNGRGTFHRLVP